MSLVACSRQLAMLSQSGNKSKLLSWNFENPSGIYRGFFLLENLGNLKLKSPCYEQPSRPSVYAPTLLTCLLLSCHRDGFAAATPDHVSGGSQQLGGLGHPALPHPQASLRPRPSHDHRRQLPLLSAPGRDGKSNEEGRVWPGNNNNESIYKVPYIRVVQPAQRLCTM